MAGRKPSTSAHPSKYQRSCPALNGPSSWVCCAHSAAQAKQGTHVFLSWHRFREGPACAAGHGAVGHRAAEASCHAHSQGQTDIRHMLQRGSTPQTAAEGAARAEKAAEKVGMKIKGSFNREGVKHCNTFTSFPKDLILMPTITAQNAGQQHVGVFGEFSPYEDRNKAESLYDTGRAT